MKYGLWKPNRRNVLPLYSFIQILYWTGNGLMFSFISVFLQDRGFTNSQIGLVLGVIYALSALLQPLLAELFSHLRVSLNQGLICQYGLVLLLSLGLLLLPLQNAALGVLVVITFALYSASAPSLNALPHAFAMMELPVNFGVARAMGSVGYAVVMSIMGAVLGTLSPALLPAFYMGTITLMIVTLGSFQTPPCGRNARHTDSAHGSFARENPLFMLFMLGILSICFNHELVSSFMLQVMQSIGGGSRELGVAVALAAISEVPVMMLYTRIRKKLKLSHAVLLCGWGWLGKNLLTAFAGTPTVVYGAQLMQSLGYALYVPMSMQLVEALLPESEYFKGLSLVGSAFTFGGVLTSLASGVLIDTLGVSLTLKLMLIFSLAGALMLTKVARGLRERKNPPSPF